MVVPKLIGFAILLVAS